MKTENIVRRVYGSETEIAHAIFNSPPGRAAIRGEIVNREARQNTKQIEFTRGNWENVWVNKTIRRLGPPNAQYTGEQVNDIVNKIFSSIK